MSEFVPTRLLAAFALVTFSTAECRAVTIPTVPVGFAGNAPDPATGFGAVSYDYSIGKLDVTNAQYVEFLNAKASAADPYGLWNPNMQSSGFNAIFRSGPGPYAYSVPSSSSSKPVVFVSWYDAIRFVNWLTNRQGSGDTESGSYTITNGGDNSGTVANPDAPTRALWASEATIHWLLPSENEWYKAAYFGGSSDTYYAYPLQSNSPPAAMAPSANSNSGNFKIVTGIYPYNTDSYPAYNSSGSYLTDVGAYPNSLSAFGAFDMAGDVFQWNEATIDSSHGVRGGAWSGDVGTSAASFRVSPPVPPLSYYSVGFRAVSVGGVPEPATIVMAVIGFVGLLTCNKRVRANPRLHPGRDTSP